MSEGPLAIPVRKSCKTANLLHHPLASVSFVLKKKKTPYVPPPHSQRGSTVLDRAVEFRLWTHSWYIFHDRIKIIKSNSRFSAFLIRNKPLQTDQIPPCYARKGLNLLHYSGLGQVRCRSNTFQGALINVAGSNVPQAPVLITPLTVHVHSRVPLVCPRHTRLDNALSSFSRDKQMCSPTSKRSYAG